MMNKIVYLLIIATLISCNSDSASNIKEEDKVNNQVVINNDATKERAFLSCMYSDSYFPRFLVDKCRDVLKRLCINIEKNNPKSLEELYVITHQSTNELNGLQNEFHENNSEIETAARECLAVEFEFIATSYGFEADLEELIATREW